MSRVSPDIAPQFACEVGYKEEDVRYRELDFNLIEPGRVGAGEVQARVGIAALRESDPDVDALITDLKHSLATGGDASVFDIGADEHYPMRNLTRAHREKMAELIAGRVLRHIERQNCNNRKRHPAGPWRNA